MASAGVDGLAGLLPAACLSRELRGSAENWSFPILPAEKGLVARAVPRRRAEFAAVRYCARSLLSELGHPELALLPDERGAPRWPPGVVGSMTHTDGYCAAALTESPDIASVGIDAEADEALPDDVRVMIIRPDERVHLDHLTQEAGSVHWDKVVFSAKEALYKAWHPLTRQWLGFQDASIRISAPTGRFSARLLGNVHVVGRSALRLIHGRFVVVDELVLTAVVIPAEQGLLHSESELSHMSA